MEWSLADESSYTGAVGYLNSESPQVVRKNKQEKNTELKQVNQENKK